MLFLIDVSSLYTQAMRFPIRFSNSIRSSARTAGEGLYSIIVNFSCYIIHVIIYHIIVHIIHVNMLLVLYNMFFFYFVFLLKTKNS